MMRKMKDSEIEWIGQIPEDWNVRKLKSIATIQTGNTPDKNNDNYYTEDEGVMWVKSDNLNGVVPIKNTAEKLSDEGKKVARIATKGSTLVCCIGSIGKYGVIDTDMAYNQQINAVTFDRNIVMDKFGTYLIAISESQHWLYANGNVLKILNNEGQGKIVYAFPDLKEQHKIVSFLDDKVGEIDTILLKTKESIEEYKNYKNALVAEAITKGLDKTVPMQESGIEWVGKMPSHWKVHTLSQVFAQLKNKNSDLSETNLLSLSYGKIKRKDINSSDGLLPESFDGYNIIDKNDIVLRLTDLQNDHKSLRVGHVKERGIITSAYVTLRCKEDIATDYYYYFLHTFDVFKGFYGMGAGVRQGLNYEGIRRMKILSPDVQEQQEIVEYLNVKCAEIDALVAKKEIFVEEMETYKKSLIYEYVTGKKEVK